MTHALQIRFIRFLALCAQELPSLSTNSSNNLSLPPLSRYQLRQIYGRYTVDIRYIYGRYTVHQYRHTVGTSYISQIYTIFTKKRKNTLNYFAISHFFTTFALSFTTQSHLLKIQRLRFGMFPKMQSGGNRNALLCKKIFLDFCAKRKEILKIHNSKLLWLAPPSLTLSTPCRANSLPKKRLSCAPATVARMLMLSNIRIKVLLLPSANALSRLSRTRSTKPRSSQAPPNSVLSGKRNTPTTARKPTAIPIRTPIPTPLSAASSSAH